MSAKSSVLIIVSSVTLAACGATGEHLSDTTPPLETAAVKSAVAELRDAAGKVVGMATVSGTDGALSVEVKVNDMPAGRHGAHIHETGDCSTTGFTSAGGHWNPDATNHGHHSEPPHPHAGDIGNLAIGSDGTGILSGTSNGTWAGLLDANGSAFVIHADPDDMTSQPAGNAGARIACGVFAAS